MAVTETSTTHKIVAAAEKPAQARRRAATPLAAETARSRRLRIPPIVLILLALVAGMAVGALVARQHYKAKNVVAAVNGVVITKDDFFHRMELASGPQILHQMVGEELQLQYATKMGLAPTDKEVDAQFDQMSKMPGFWQKLAASNQSVEDFKRTIRVQLAAAAVLGKGQRVTETEMRAFYKAQTDPRNPKAQFYTPATVRIEVIITKTEARAQAALHELAGGSSFAAVAKTYSQDGSHLNGGLLPPFAQGRTKVSQVPGLEEAIFGLPINGQLGPQKFAGAWWIIRCVDKSAAVTQPFDQVKDECRNGVLVAKGLSANASKTQQAFHDFQKSATIQAFWPQYSQALAVK